MALPLLQLHLLAAALAALVWPGPSLQMLTQQQRQVPELLQSHAAAHVGVAVALAEHTALLVVMTTPMRTCMTVISSSVTVVMIMVTVLT